MKAVILYTCGECGHTQEEVRNNKGKTYKCKKCKSGNLWGKL